MRPYRLPRAIGLLLAGVLLFLAMSVPAMARHAEIGGEITAVDFEFQGDMTIPAGTNVLFVNDGNEPHTLSGTNGRFDSGAVFPDGERVVATEHLRPGDYDFFCRVHPFMVATLTVE